MGAGPAGAAAAGVAAVAATGAEARRSAPAAAVLLAALLVAPAAVAQPSEIDLRAARQLFADAEKDERAEHWADALEKLQRVEQVKLTAGVRFHVALCHEHLGQLAAALEGYTAAEAQARVEGAQDVLRIVGKRIADLSPRVPRITVHVQPASADVAVTIDGTAMQPAAVGTPVPVDPGAHRVEGTAAGFAPATATVTVREHETKGVDLKLEPGPATNPSPSPTATPSPTPGPTPSATPSATPGPTPLPAATPTPTETASHTPAIVATAGAAVLAAGGVAFFLLAGSAHDSAVQQCAQVVSASACACDSKKTLVRGWIAAAAAGTVAVTLWLRSPSTEAPAAALVLGPGSVGLRGAF